MIKKIAIFVLVFALAAAVVFTGCTPARRPYNNNTGIRTGYDYGNDMGTNQNVNFQRNPNVANNWGLGEWNNGYTTDMYNNNLTNKVNVNTTTRRADDIARACEAVQGVDNATAVVAGNTAYVGVDLEANTRIANERNIKNEIAQKVRAAGRDIDTVYVSTEPDFMDRLRNIGQGLRNGRPVDAFTDELREMVQRITPARW